MVQRGGIPHLPDGTPGQAKPGRYPYFLYQPASQEIRDIGHPSFVTDKERRNL